ncbi:hypothetical protein ACPV5M_26825, partial [Vibrio mediterranei]
SDDQLLILMSLVIIVLCLVSVCPPPPIETDKSYFEGAEKKLGNETTSQQGAAPWFLFLLAVFFSMFLSSNLMELGPLLIKEVYQVNIGNSALGMAISAIISIFMLESAGRWMQRSGPFKVW